MATNIDSLQRVQILSYVQLVIQATYLNLMIVLDLLVLESDIHLFGFCSFNLLQIIKRLQKLRLNLMFPAPEGSVLQIQ